MLEHLSVLLLLVSSVFAEAAASPPGPVVLLSVDRSPEFDINLVIRSACFALLDHLIEDAKSRRVRGPGSSGNSQGDIDLRRLLAVKSDPVEAARIPKGVAYVVVSTGARGVTVAFYWLENIYSYSCIVDPKTYKIVVSSPTATIYSTILDPLSPDDKRGPRKLEE